MMKEEEEKLSSTTTTTTTTEKVTLTQSAKFDLLAKQVLRTSGILSSLPKTWFRDEKELCHVKALERVLDITIADTCTDAGAIGREAQGRSSLQDSDSSLSAVTTSMSASSSSSSSTGKLFTCTDFNSSSPFSPNRDIPNFTADGNPPQYWTPTPEIASHANGITGLNSGNDNIEMETEMDMDIPLLEEKAPFSRKFYQSVGQLLSFVYSSNSQPSTEVNIHIEANNDYQHQLPKLNPIENEEKDLQNYSLRDNVYSVKVTRILSALMDLNVIGFGNNDQVMIRKRKLSSDDDDQQEESENRDTLVAELSFIDLLLYHTEQNSTVLQYDFHQSKDDNNISNAEVIQRNKSTSTSTIHIPFIQSLFKHYSTLPQLESHIHTIIRIYRSSSSRNIDAKVQHMKLSQSLQDRLENELQSHISSLEYIIGTIYSKCDVPLRKKTRLRIGNFLKSFVLKCSSSSSGVVGGVGLIGIGVENTSAAGVDSMLNILLRILKGIRSGQEQRQRKQQQIDSNMIVDGNNKPNQSHLHLLFHVLLPLHNPSSYVLWRDQTPIIGLYHKSLVQCIASILILDTSLIGKVIHHLLHPDVWPVEGGNGSKKGSKMANTPKVVLLLHEIDTLIGLLKVKEISVGGGKIDGHEEKEQKGDEYFDTLSDTIVPLIIRLSSCISSDNSRTSERALEFFKNNKFQSLVKLHIARVMTPLVKALCRINSGMEIPWNPTVRKMTLLVLRELKSFNEDQFQKSCVECLSRQSDVGRGVVSTKKQNREERKNNQLTGSVQTQSYNESPTTDMMSLRKSMGSWKPPNRRNPRSSTSISLPNAGTKIASTPPMTVTGIAPRSIQKTSQKSSQAQPPLTVTGVAPWSIKTSPNGTNTKPSCRLKPVMPARLPNPSSSKKEMVGEKSLSVANSSNNCQLNESRNETPNDSSAAAVAKIDDFIFKLKESQTEQSSTDGISDWAKSQMSESPLLMPSLKFHDLVFGQVLGTGSFSTVKYARKITKGKTRTFWPEFAVKVRMIIF